MTFIELDNVQEYRYSITCNGVVTDNLKHRNLRWTDDRGFKTVGFAGLDGKVRRRYVHRLVAQYFVANPMGYNQVIHLDGDRSNNQASNLRWMNDPSKLPAWLR